MCNRAVHIVFFFNDTATTEIYTLSLHDALPISVGRARDHEAAVAVPQEHDVAQVLELQEIDHVRYVGLEIDLRRSEMHPDRKSTRLNSSHANISYAVFCLKKKKDADTPRAVRAT